MSNPNKNTLSEYHERDQTRQHNYELHALFLGHSLPNITAYSIWLYNYILNVNYVILNL